MSLASPPGADLPLRFPNSQPRIPAMPRQAIHSAQAPAAIGPYSQAVRSGNTVFLSGQIPLDPGTGQLVEGDITAQARRAFDNLRAVCEASGGSFADIVRLGLYLTDLDQFAAVNAVMADYFEAPYPARSTVEVAGLPRGAQFEVDAILVLG
jgi:reactive intermediate/imine deaminase